MIRKKLPGAEVSEMVYDQLDRLVLSRDGNLRKDSLWLFIKYDELGRPVLTGYYKNPDSREEMQAILNTKSENVENRTDANYSNNAFPANNCTPLTVTYYDDYSFIANPEFNYSLASFSLQNQEYPEIIEPVLASSTKGFATGTKVFVPGTGKWLLNVSYYDRYGKVLQNITENHLGGTDRSSQIYDFRGKVICSKLETKTRTGNLHSIEKRFEYDHAERLTKVYYKIDSLPAIVMTENKYNELGQLVEKKLHSAKDDGNYLESMTYTYNIRGWITKINDPENMGNHLFAMELTYDQPEEGLDAFAQYNGNISSMVWSSKNLTEKRGYGFQYDKLNRLTKAQYGKNTAGWTPQDEDYSVPLIGYDLNGNIDTLVRAGLVSPGNYGQIDQLKYSYNGNQLIAVDDEGEETEDAYDFRDKGSKYNKEYSLPEYEYDANGNMISDANKGIIHIKYNHLNLPEEILLENNRMIRYLYDAVGAKLRKDVFNEYGTLVDTWDYNGSFVYQNRQLKFVLTDEGKISMDSTVYTYEYFLKDHLGNTRVSFAVAGNSLEIIQENHYYPFGMAMHGLNSKEMEQPAEKNKYLYNGKELQDDFGLGWYDYGFRMYDPGLGRWHSIDPHAENYLNWTPFNYVASNPILLVDPDGMDWFYHSIDGFSDPTWNWHDGNGYNTGVKNTNGEDVVLQGVEAVVVFEGSVDEKLGTKEKGDKGYDGKHTGGYMDGEGAQTASVTVYGPDGADDVSSYTGYTMSSDPSKYGVVNDGTYDANYDKTGKSGALKSNWTLNARGRVSSYWDNPNRPNQKDNNGNYYLTGIFIHRSNNSGWAGGGVSKGCLLISPNDWKNFNNQMNGVKNFKVQITRTTHVPYRLPQTN